jgi:4'-phosphopantetheinyl transferase
VTDADVPTRDAADARRLRTSDGVELWLIDLRFEPSAAMQSWLGAEELQRAARFVFARDRRRYLAAHTALRQVLGQQVGTAPRDLRFTHGEFGKPALLDARCSFNLSHSDDDAAVLLADAGEVGVDLEALRAMPDASALAQRHFSAEENAALEGLGARDRDAAFLTCWTRKEACLKAIGSGLSIAPRTFTAGVLHDTLRLRIATPRGAADVTVQSFCHEQRLCVAWARVSSVHPRG